MSGWCPDCLCTTCVCDLGPVKGWYERAIAEGRREERAAIVAFIQDQIDGAMHGMARPSPEVRIMSKLADHIERGEHDHE